jgi:hypothetical protein
MTYSSAVLLETAGFFETLVLLAKVHGITFHKTTILVLITVKTSKAS